MPLLLKGASSWLQGLLMTSWVEPTRLEQGAAPGFWARRIGILNDYVRVPYANGSSFASQFLYREFSARGHQVTVIGPADRDAAPHELPRNHVCFPSVPLRSHPGVQLGFPTRRSLRELVAKRLDVLLGQSCTAMLDLGAWLRAAHDVPFLCVNTVHLPSVYNVLLPDSLNSSRVVNSVFAGGIIPLVERTTADNYNDSDGLIVLSDALKEYWRQRGVKVPIHVIPRAVEPKIFDSPVQGDPFPVAARRGSRLLCVCRHTREKGLARLLEVFARWIAPAVPAATLTLVGDGPDHEAFRAAARRLGVAARVLFPGELPISQLPAWYRNADLFLYTSLSETYGQVVSEALWCGLPVVALADGMGVCQQVQDGVNGVLVDPGQDDELVDWRFGSEAVALLRKHVRRRALAEGAVRTARLRSQPERCVARYYEAIDAAKRHSRATARLRARRRPQRYLARWTALHMALAGLGCIRPPATINRYGRKQPAWEAFEPEPVRESSPSIVVPVGPVPAGEAHPPGTGEEALGA
jgi:1,2-diacylglycerol 3-alpha-glucosyltransferase